MRNNLGPLGIVGIVLLIAGIGLIAYQDYVIAAGLGLMLAGVGLVVKSIVTGMLSAWGMA